MLGLLAAILIVLCALDLSRPPSEQVTVRFLIGGLHVHRALLAPVLGRLGVRCRFSPTCSRYAETVLERFGALRGSRLAVGRLLRCGPWTAPGTVDPPPPALAPGLRPS